MAVMSAWIPITIAAAFLQNLRFMLQKHLKASTLSTGGATFARFLFASPLAVLVAGAYVLATDSLVQLGGVRFWTFVLAGGLSQIVGTACVVALFSLRNFSVGMSIKNTEILQIVLVSYVVLGEAVSPFGFAAIAVGFAGLWLLSGKPGATGAQSLRAQFDGKSVLLGLVSGGLFAISAVGYRGASLSLPGDDVFLRAALTLASVTTSQTVMMALWLRFREPGQISEVVRNWRVAGLGGLTSMLGSLGWFVAFTLTNAAYVRALGQIELVFSYAASVFWFGETPSRRENLGIVLLLLSIVVLILALK
jgi:drug/metabolite transporter (DMT)-like permease